MDYLGVTYPKINGSQYPTQLANYLFDRFNLQDKRLIDVGCGCCDFTNAFIRLGLGVAMTDRKYIPKYHERFNCVFRESNFEHSINFDPFYDVAFCKSVLEHIHNQDIFMKELYRILKPNGKLILLVPNWNSQKNIFFDDPTHIHPYTQKSIKDLLKMYEFENVQSEVFYQLPIVWQYPSLKFICKGISLLVKPEHYPKNKFIRWSTETMVLGYGEKHA